MREIKFRFWNVGNKRWVNPSEIEFAYQDVNNESVGIPFHLFQEEIIYQQYTGLIDKNGREIYEGDILKIEWRIDSIDSDYYYDDVTFSKNLGMWLPHAVLTTDDIPCEIIGNIFENPDLMETKFYLHKR